MKRGQSLSSATTTGLLTLWLFALSGLVWAAPHPGSGKPPAKAPGESPKSQVVEKFLHDCFGKPVKDSNCEKLRKDSVEILKEDLLRLGSHANRTYMPTILRMFWSDEVELRIAAADAIGMIGPQDSDVEMLAPLANDPVPNVRQAVSQMISRGKGNAIALLNQRTIPMRTGRTPDSPDRQADPAKFSMPVAPDSTYWFDSSDASVGRLSYVAKGKNDPAQFYKTKAKKGPFKLDEFKEKYRYQLQDEQEALDQAQQTAGKQLENEKPPDPTNLQAFTDYMQRMQSVSMQGSMGRMSFDAYQSNLYGAPTVYVLEERQIGQRSYPTRYVVVYQELAFRKPGYRLSWMTVPDSAVKTAQVTSLKEQQEEETLRAASKKEEETAKKRGEALDNLIKKKDEQEKSKFKKGQADLEKELGF